MVEFAMITAVLISVLAGAIFYMQEKAEERLIEGRSLFECHQLCDPKAPNCDC